MDFLEIFMGKLEASFNTVAELEFLFLGLTFSAFIEIFKELYTGEDGEPTRTRIMIILGNSGFDFVAVFFISVILGPRFVFFIVIFVVLFSTLLRSKVYSYFGVSVKHEEAEHKKSNKLQHEVENSVYKYSIPSNPTILEVLLYYGYIGFKQKESVEMENIFDSPEEIAKKFKERPILTEEELREAHAIMNLIRIRGRLLTREEAIQLLLELKKEVDKNDKGSTK